MGLLIVASSLAWSQQEGIDFNRARHLRQRSLRGEKLTEEERTYLQRAIETRQRGRSRDRSTPEPTVGLKPLSDMNGDDR